jgi:hypothetical protein
LEQQTVNDAASVVRRVGLVLGLVFLPWSAGSVLLVGGGAAGILWWRWCLFAVWLFVGLGLWKRLGPTRRWSVPWLLFLSALLLFYSVRPSHTRGWSEDQSRVPWSTIEGDTIRFHEVRDFRYTSPSEWESAWYDADYKLSDLEKGYYVVEYFSEHEAIAHTLVSFRFAGDRFLAFSVEIRKEEGESFSPLRGLFRQYELLYVVADERDALKLRTHYRDSRVRLHPIEGSAEGLRAYFLDVVARVNALKEKPEFYNSLTSSCTTNLSRHLEAVTTHRLTFDKRIYLPGYSSELVWELGLLGEGSLEELIARDTVTAAKIASSADSNSYSLLIRGEPVTRPP